MNEAQSTSGQVSTMAGGYLTFAISKERYGIEILKVQEIIQVPQITTVPRCPDFLRGVINLRGKIIPIMELRRKFGIETKPFDQKTCIIVINIERNGQRVPLGLVVDTVLEVINFIDSEIEPAPQYGDSMESGFIAGIGKKDSALNILLDIDKIITEKESVKLAGLSD